MNDNAKKWVKALRSGEYTQGTGSLACAVDDDPIRYCCLGVACDLYVKEHPEFQVTKNQGHECLQYGETKEEAVLPVPVVEWLGLNSDVGDLKGTHCLGDSLVDLNDAAGYNFDQIAGVVEEREDVLFA